MKTTLLLNILSVCLSMGGTLLMFLNTPRVDSNTYLYNHDELIEIEKRDNRKNMLTRVGMGLLFLGFLFQLIALMIDR